MGWRAAFFSGSAAAALGAFLSVPTAEAQAQTVVEPALTLDQIVVTARRREENLMQVPIAISAFSEEELEANAVFDLLQLSEFTPGMFAVYGGNGRPDRSDIQLTFRGLSVSSGLVFIDGAPYTGGLTPNLQGVERVEVLKGPQSAYFGRSTFSGAINFVTKGVPDELQGTLKADISEYGGSDTSVSLGGPVIEDKLGLRVNYRHYYLEGYYTNAFDTTDRLGQQQTDSVNAVVDYNASDNLDIKLFVEYARDDDGAPYNIALKANKEIFCDLGGAGGPYHCGALPDLDDIPPGIISGDTQLDEFAYDVLINNSFNLRTNHFDPSFKDSFGLRRDAYLAHLNVDYELDNGWAISSLLAYHRTKSQSVQSPDYRNGRDTPNMFFALGRPNTLPYHRFALVSQNLQQDFNAEIRVTTPQNQRLRGTLGANYLHLRSPGGNIYGISPLGPIGTGSVTRTRVYTPAIFGGLYYDLTEHLTLTAEARYQWDEISAEAVEPTAAAKLENTYRSFSPRVSIDWQYNDDTLLYALYSRGYRPGGFNGSIVGQPEFVLAQLREVGVNIAYDEESLDNFEVGLKATWWDGRAQTTIAAYHDLWRDGQIQNTTFFMTPDGAVQQTTLTTNQGEVKMNGIEVEGTVALTDNLTVNGTFGYSDAEFEVYFYIPDGNNIHGTPIVTGNRLDQAPKTMWTLSPEYKGRLARDFQWYARLDYRHRGRFFTDPTNVAWVPENDLFNLRAGITNGNLKLELYVKNLTDNDSLLGGVKGNDSFGFSERGRNDTNEIRVILPNPRVLGLRATYEF